MLGRQDITLHGRGAQRKSKTNLSIKHSSSQVSKRPEIIAERDGNNWEIGAQRKDRKQSQKVGAALVLVRLEVERVEILQLGGCGVRHATCSMTQTRAKDMQQI